MKLIMENFKKAMNEQSYEMDSMRKTAKQFRGGKTPVWKNFRPVDSVGIAHQGVLDQTGQIGLKGAGMMAADRVAEYLMAFGYCADRDEMGRFTNCYIGEDEREGGGYYAVICLDDCKGVGGLEEELDDVWLNYLMGKADEAPKRGVDYMPGDRGPDTMGE